MGLFEIVFYAIAALTVASALVMTFSKSVIYAAVGLLFTFFGVAGIYVLLAADFIAVVQLLIYVGGILVLLLFGVMLSQKSPGVNMKTETLKRVPALIVVAGVLAILVRIIYGTNWNVLDTAPFEPTSRRIGQLLMTDFLIPFEVVSILLLGALIGAAFIARKERR